MSIRMVVSRGFAFAESGGCGMVAPVLAVADNADGSTADGVISGSTAGGPLNTVKARLADGTGEIIDAGDRNGDGALVLTFPSTGDWLAYVESTLGADTSYSTPVLFTILPAGGGNPESGSGQLISVSLAVNADTYVSNGSDMAVNFGAADELRIGSTFIAAVDKHYRAIVRVPLGVIPQDVAVDEAFLILNGDGTGTIPSPLTVTAYRLNQPLWMEHEATWNNYATGLPWVAGGGDFLVDGTEVSEVVASAGAGLLFVGFEAMVRKALDLGLLYLDVLVKGPETPSAPSSFVDCYSRTALAIDGLKPYLSVSYRANMTGSVSAVAAVRPAITGKFLVNSHAYG